MMFAAHYMQAFGEAAHPTATAKMSALGPQVLCLAKRRTFEILG